MVPVLFEVFKGEIRVHTAQMKQLIWHSAAMWVMFSLLFPTQAIISLALRIQVYSFELRLTYIDCEWFGCLSVGSICHVCSKFPMKPTKTSSAGVCSVHFVLTAFEQSPLRETPGCCSSFCSFQIKLGNLLKPLSHQ